MGLRERAIKAYEEEKKRRKEYEKRKTKNFAELSVREFERVFGTKPDQVQPVTPHECLIKCDGLTFRVKQEDRITFEVSVPCSECHNEFFIGVNSLSSLGEVLSNPTIKCPECMEFFRAFQSEPSEPSVEEQIVQKLREILDLLQEGWGSASSSYSLFFPFGGESDGKVGS